MNYMSKPGRASAVYPNSPGWRGHSETSRLAAFSVAADARNHRERILKALKDALPAGRSSEDISADTGLTIYQVRSRVSELQAAGKVICTEERVKNETGRSANVWRAA